VFRLDGPERPTDGDGLSRALTGGLEPALADGSRPPRVNVKTADWPALASLEIDLTGTALGSEVSPVIGAGDSVDAGPTAATVSVVGRPVTIVGTEMTLVLDARDVVFAWAVGEDGGNRLALDRHAGGDLHMFVAKDELERRVAEGLKAKAGGQGAKILSVELEITESGDNRIEVEIAVTVRIMFKAKLRAKGELTINDRLDLVVASASVVGESMAGKTVAGLVRPQLASLEGKEFALGTVLPAGIELADVRLRVDEGLDIRGRILPSPAD